jgi:hypothetical protein
MLKTNVGKTLHIATFGTDSEGILAGIRDFPVHKLILLHYSEQRESLEEFVKNIRSVLGIPISTLEITMPDVIRSALENINKVIENEKEEYEQILINVSAGDKMIGCAALSCAFINGIKAFGVDSNGSPMMLPILKMSYKEIISDAKIKILKALYEKGGSVENLDELVQASGFGKPLLSYHINGTLESKGLLQLGLVDVEKSRSKSKIVLNTLGQLIIQSSN